MPSYARLRDGGERGEAGFAARPLWPEKQEDAEDRSSSLLLTCTPKAVCAAETHTLGEKHSQAARLQPFVV